MEALLIVLAGAAFAALLAGLGYIVRLVVRHETTDAAVIASIDGLDKRMGLLERKAEKVEDRLLAVELAAAEINGKTDRILAKLG